MSPIGPGPEKLIWVRLRFARWLALPTAERPKSCRSQEEFAKLVHVGTDQLMEWRREEGFWDEVFKEASHLVGEELPEIVKAMVREAKIGSVHAAKLCLSMLDLDKPIRIRVDDQLTIVLTEDDEDSAEP